ncbi:MAG: hypothetical protein D6761_04430 [Candidatus Dadabacteria bacterium]|nr:MAG: hypothetical protein D6761_04430 [Candidatus Dadabacteria bacterium]
MQCIEQEYQPWIVMAGERTPPLSRLSRVLAHGIGARVWASPVAEAVNLAGQLLPDLAVVFADGHRDSAAMLAVERIARLPVWVPSLVLIDAATLPQERAAYRDATELLLRPVDAEALCEAARRLIELRRGALSLGELEPTAAADSATGLLPAMVALPLLEEIWSQCAAADQSFGLVAVQLRQLPDIEWTYGPRVANVVRREVIRHLSAAFDFEHVFATARDTIAVALPGALPESGFHKLQRTERGIADAVRALPFDLDAQPCAVRLASAERRVDRAGSIQELLLCALTRLEAGGIELVAA